LEEVAHAVLSRHTPDRKIGESDFVCTHTHNTQHTCERPIAPTSAAVATYNCAEARQRV
jgi:hypothetical protein